MDTQKFNEAIRLIDEANGKDPNKEVIEGQEFSKELLYGKRMSAVLDRFNPEASEAVKIAVRSQHICRWEIPRNSYEMNRTGYLLWRKELKKFHAKIASQILADLDYDSETIEKVSFLLQKKQLKRNEESQLLEDIACLVFLEFYFEDFTKKYPEEKLIDILQKTWKKMSEKAHDAALKLSFSKEAFQLIQKALA